MKLKNLIIPALLSIAMAACTSSDDKQGAGDTVINGDTVATKLEASMCFLRTEGTKNQDTTSTELVIKNGKVSGQMYWHPFEKDSRKGTLAGTLKGDTVYATWSFMQEGMQDTMALQFLIKGDKLMQKPLIANAKTGRQQTDASAGFTVLHHPSVTLKK
jgi:hypothetical protein